MEKELALLVGGPHDGRQVETYPGQGVVKMPRIEAYETHRVLSLDPGPVYDEHYMLHRVHDSRGFHRLIGLLASDTRGPMQALYEGYSKGGNHA